MIEKTVMDTVHKLCHDGLEDDARVFIIDSIQELASSDMWSNIDTILAELDVDDFTDHPLVLLALLVSTTCFSSYLPRRRSVLLATERMLSSKYTDQEFVRQLMIGTGL